MAVSNRADTINNVYKVLKKHYQPVTPAQQRSLMENLLFACCLEDAPNAMADDCFARLQESYFDWNEVRVTTVRELGEIFGKIPNATSNALNLKNTLQSVFESQYTFDLEPLKKQNLGKTVALLESYKGTTQFTIAYVTQMNLGGHAIPLGKGGIDIMYIVGAIDEKEAAAGNVPGLERAIPKAKGLEFSSLLHQLAAELTASPFSQKVRNILLEMNPDCKPRLPKRIDKKKIEAERKKKEEEERKRLEAEAAAAKKAADDKKKAEKEAAKKAADEKKKAEAKKKADAKKLADEKKKAAKAKQAEKAAAKKKAAKKKVVKKSTVKKKAAAKKVTKKVAKKTTKKAAPKKKKLVKKTAKKASKKSASKQLARKKPR